MKVVEVPTQHADHQGRTQPELMKTYFLARQLQLKDIKLLLLRIKVLLLGKSVLSYYGEWWQFTLKSVHGYLPIISQECLVTVKVD